MAEGTSGDSDSVLGEIAHIVAERSGGPRGANPLVLEQRNRADNLMLLCHIHHQLVDDQPERYTVAVLRRMRDDHVGWVKATLGRGVHEVPVPPLRVHDTLHSTLLALQSIPRDVYSAPCALEEREVAPLVHWPTGATLVAYVIRSGRLYTFTDLRRADGPFAKVIDAAAVTIEPVSAWFGDTRLDWFIALVNQAISKLMRRKGLAYDKAHRRFYFAPRARNETVEITYRPLNQKAARTKVVWQPVRRATGETRRYWLHRAASLRLLRTGELSFALAIRPELHVTTDGVEDYSARYVGSKVTRKKARWFNHEYLGQVQLWRDYLSGSAPRIILPLGGSSIIIDSALASSNVDWPGIPERFEAPFSNTQTQEDLFSFGEYVHRDDPLEGLGPEEDADDDE
jgi:hypothetical protein